MVVTTSNLYSESRKVIKDLINQNVTDPVKGRKNSSRRWIYRAEPDTTSRSFDGYPFIVLRSADIGSDFVTLNGCVKDNVFLFTIELYTEFNDQTGKIDEISDEIYDLLTKSKYIDEFESKGLHAPIVLDSAKSETIIDGKLLEQRLFTVEFGGLFAN